MTVTHVGDIKLDAGGGGYFGVQVLSQMSAQSDGEHTPECLVCLPQKGGRQEGSICRWELSELVC